MKKTIFYSAVLLTLLTLTSCEVNDSYYYDDTPPEPPSGIVVFNGDSRVDLSWNENYERDVAGYNVYYSYDYHGKYTLIGSTESNYFIDNDASNGETYYYAVTAYDYNGNESDLSYDVVYSTPRPEGFNQSVSDYLRFPGNGGYSFRDYSVVPYDDEYSDFFFENYEGTFYLDVWDDTDIQDMGPTNDIYDIDYAPLDGWSETKDAIAVPGHTYVIWTWDNHFAKIRVSYITNERIVFDWAYQLVEGNPQLKMKNIPEKRNPLNRVNNRGTSN
jgi:hypothetical protein